MINEGIIQDLAVFIAQDLLDCVDVILLVGFSQENNSLNLRVISVDFCLTSLGVVDFRTAQDTCQDHILEDSFGSGVSDLLIVLEAFEHFVESIVPFLLAHEYLPTGFFYNCHNSGVVND